MTEHEQLLKEVERRNILVQQSRFNPFYIYNLMKAKRKLRTFENINDVYSRLDKKQ